MKNLFVGLMAFGLFANVPEEWKIDKLKEMDEIAYAHKTERFILSLKCNPTTREEFWGIICSDKDTFYFKSDNYDTIYEVQ